MAHTSSPARACSCLVNTPDTAPDRKALCPPLLERDSWLDGLAAAMECPALAVLASQCHSVKVTPASLLQWALGVSLRSCVNREGCVRGAPSPRWHLHSPYG